MLRITATRLRLGVDLPSPLAGYEASATADSVGRQLEANIAVLRKGGQTAVLVTLDALFIGRALRTGIEDRLAGSLSPEQLIMAASHTHYAPPTDIDKPLLGHADPQWVGQLVDIISREVRRLLGEDSAAVTVRYGTGATDVAVNRRLKRSFAVTRRGVRLRTTVLAPNPAGFVDRTIHMIEFRKGDTPVAVLWSMACHPVSLHCASAVDAHYIGHVRDLLRRRAGDRELPVLFLQGFAGDCRPNVTRRRRSTRGLAQRLATGPGFGRFPTAAFEAAWMDRVAVDVAGIECEPIATETLKTVRITLPRSRFVESSSEYPAAFAGLRLGPLSLLGGSAEFVGAYRRLICGHRNRNTITFGYIDDVVGYAATSEMLPRGGYEVEGFCRSFSVRRVNPKIESAVLRGFGEVIADLQGDQLRSE